jgi:DNA-binding CsgD family transcriptional regulator
MAGDELTPAVETETRPADRSVDRLYGRDHELGLLSGLLGQAAGGALIIRGEAGIGKSALLAAVNSQARQQGIRVLTAVGVQSEARLGYAGLHQLLRPILYLTERLPAPQRAALLSAFGMSEGAAPEIFLIGLATLELISHAADTSPVLVIADDAQWLDEPSRAVLTVVARRLAVEPALMLVAMREGPASPFDEAALPELRLAGLAEAAARDLLASRAPCLEPGLRERLIEEAAGNPLALVELPDVLRTAGGGAGVPWPRLPLTARLEHAFAAQGSGLPRMARSVLLAAAADDGDILQEILDAASVMAKTRVTAEALAPAEAARLVVVTHARLVFRHPLVRSATYQAASAPCRRAAHAALAEVLADQPDRQVWHKAAASVGPSEQVAADLDKAAARAGRRGAARVAIDALTSAAKLSTSPASQGRRLLRAAETAFEAGHPTLGPQLLAAAEQLDLPAEDRTWLSWLREAFTEGGWSGTAKIESFVAQAGRMSASGHGDLAAQSLLAIALRCYWGNPSQQIRSAVVTAAGRLPLAGNEPTLLAILALADPVQRGTLVNDQMSRMTPDAADPVGMFLIGSAATAVWAWDRSLAFLDVAITGLRAQGRLGLLTQALVSQAWMAVHLSRKPLALAAAEEASSLARETGQLRWAIAAQLAQATVASEQGNHDVAEALTRDAEAVLLPMGANPMLALVQFARGRGALLQQRYAEGLEQLRRILDPADPSYHPFVGSWGLADLVEAALHAGNNDTAAAYLSQLEALAARTSGPMLHAQTAYARPLAAGDETAEGLYQMALEHELANWPAYRNRMLLWYGRWLRRQRRPAESRAPLRAARDGFDALGLSHLAEQARRELRAAGESSRRRPPHAWEQLTPQELQIAQLAAAGLSNREIGQQLYISHRTVGVHLHRIFPKLGITSRSQLQAAITP